MKIFEDDEERDPLKGGRGIIFLTALKVINLTKTTMEALPFDGSFSFKGEGGKEGRP